MKRCNLEHIIRAATSIADCYDLVVIGSQSILGAYPNAPSELLISMEADVFVFGSPRLNDLIDGSIGEGSAFHDTFGYYAQGVGETTAILPKGWQYRLFKIQNPNTNEKIGWCLDPHDLAASKLCAEREKDIEFVEAMIKYALIEHNELIKRISYLPLDIAKIKHLNKLAERLFTFDNKNTLDSNPSPSPLLRR